MRLATLFYGFLMVGWPGEERHDLVMPYSVRFTREDRLEIGAHGATERSDTMMVAMPEYGAPELARSQQAAPD